MMAEVFRRIELEEKQKSVVDLDLVKGIKEGGRIAKTFSKRKMSKSMK